MKTVVPNNGGVMEKDAFVFRALAPAVAQEQDDRMRQIIREELTAHTSQQPSLKTKKKHASIEMPFSLALIGGFSDEFKKIKNAQMTLNSVAAKPTVQSPLASSMKPSKNPFTAKPPAYSQVNPAPQPGPTQMHQPTLSPPPVRG